MKLTMREDLILSLVAQGCNSRDAAEQIGISKRTVDFHLANIFEKLEVKNRVQAINKARSLKLIQ